MTDSYAVIGGEGFLGQCLVKELIRRHGRPKVASLGPTQRTFDSGYRFFKTDVTDYGSVLRALRNSGCNTVFHTVSPHANADPETSERINVTGTTNILRACRELDHVTKLVYTSSVTVLYGPGGLKCADDRMPTVDDTKDYYIKTKVAAEKLVLEANSKQLLTCSIRCCGLFGPGDRQVVPGLLAVLKAKQTMFQLGHNDNIFDFMYIDNAVHAHILAADKLDAPPADADALYSSRLLPVEGTIKRRKLPTSHGADYSDPELHILRSRFLAPPSSALAGQAISISNGEPVPFWSFLKACWAAYNGHEPPFTIPIPVSLSIGLAHVSEWFARLRGLKPHEAGLNVAHAHFVLGNMCMDIEKARRVLGYEPVVSLEEGIRRTIEWCKADEARQRETRQGSATKNE